MHPAEAMEAEAGAKTIVAPANSVGIASAYHNPLVDAGPSEEADPKSSAKQSHNRITVATALRKND